jgi:hypothetical protein
MEGRVKAWTLTIEACRQKMELLRVCRPVDFAIV